MTNEKKMTKREKFEMLKALSEVQASPMLTEFIEHELELLAKKNSADKKPTAQQIANAGIVNAVYEGMADNRLYTITEIIKEIPACADLTNQRVSAIIRGELGVKFERVEDKRKAYFRKIAE